MGLGMKQLTLATSATQDDAAGSVSCRDGARCTVAGAVRADRTGLSEAGQWPPAGRGRADAAHLFLAALVPAVEEALYDSPAMRRFVGIDLGREPVPDETTVCRFRHLLEEHDLGRRLFDEVQRHLAAKGLKVATGTIVDATISMRRPRLRMPRRRTKKGKPVVLRASG
jgi:Transposase domain (DUF772)